MLHLFQGHHVNWTEQDLAVTGKPPIYPRKTNGVKPIRRAVAKSVYVTPGSDESLAAKCVNARVIEVSEASDENKTDTVLSELPENMTESVSSDEESTTPEDLAKSEVISDDESSETTIESEASSNEGPSETTSESEVTSDEEAPTPEDLTESELSSDEEPSLPGAVSEAVYAAVSTVVSKVIIPDDKSETKGNSAEETSQKSKKKRASGGRIPYMAKWIRKRIAAATRGLRSVFYRRSNKVVPLMV